MNRRGFGLGAASLATTVMATAASPLELLRQQVRMQVMLLEVKETRTSGFRADLEELEVTAFKAGTGGSSVRPEVSIGLGVGSGGHHDDGVRGGIGLSINLSDLVGRPDGPATSPDINLRGLDSIGPVGYVDGKLIQSANRSTYRNVDRVIILSDGQSFVVSGLLAARQRSGTRSLPVYSQIPVVGRSFRRAAGADNRPEVVIIVSPKILAAVEGS